MGRTFRRCEGDICDNVTYPRLERVINGYKNNKKHDSNLLFYECDYISKKRDGSVPNSLLKYIKELIQLEFHCKIDNKTIILAFTEDEIDEIFTKDLSKCRKLFIPRDVFLNTQQKSILSKYKIKKIYIPEYYFARELKEVDEL